MSRLEDAASATIHPARMEDVEEFDELAQAGEHGRRDVTVGEFDDRKPTMQVAQQRLVHQCRLPDEDDARRTRAAT